ncbi:MAG: VOC family protein [bacterium]|nr:hypothetical protein [Gammaproteobacteria bacterium]
MGKFYPVVQVAYFVTDIEDSARQMYQQFGAGPFFVSKEIALVSCNHRGQPCDFVHSSAFGQWGNIMLELVQQDSIGASPFRDMYAPGEEGLHHTAMFVDSIESAINHYAELDIPLATRAVTKQGKVEFAFLDATKTMGHMLEIYVGHDALTGFYTMVKDASQNWDGGQLLRY